MREQNLRKRFALRSQDNGGDMSFSQNSTSTVGNNFLLNSLKLNQTFFEEKNQWKLIIFEINDVTGVEKLGTEQNFVLFKFQQTNQILINKDPGYM